MSEVRSTEGLVERTAAACLIAHATQLWNVADLPGLTKATVVRRSSASLMTRRQRRQRARADLARSTVWHTGRSGTRRAIYFVHVDLDLSAHPLSWLSA
ncbi:hypothetical protein AB1Y20_010353 [Prymnesium parvum]|uniref:Uncharacterized protein n=1 Tax=Prymnesium parvum TaxID=97485 RepID=A0AB34K762_PRYPA